MHDRKHKKWSELINWGRDMKELLQKKIINANIRGIRRACLTWKIYLQKKAMTLYRVSFIKQHEWQTFIKAIYHAAGWQWNGWKQKETE